MVYLSGDLHQKFRAKVDPPSLTLAKKEVRAKNSHTSKSFNQKVTVAEVSQMGCMDLGNELQRQKKGPWS